MIELAEDYFTTCEILSKTTNHIPGLYVTGEKWKTPQWDFFAKEISIELGRMNVYQAFLWNGSYLYEFGYRLLSPTKIEEKIQSLKRKMFQEYIPNRLVATGSFEKDGLEFTSYSSIHSLEQSGLVLVLVCKKDQHPAAQDWSALVQLLESLGYAIGGKEKRFLPMFSEFSKYFIGMIQLAIQDGKSGVITHFYIQELDKYFEVMGMQKSFEILKSIQHLLKNHIKKEDIFIHHNPRSYFVFSPDCNSEIVLKRFEEVFLQIQHLIVDYRMSFLEVNSKTSLEEEWNRFLVEGQSGDPNPGN